MLKGTHVPVDQILASLENGESVEEVAYNYDLKAADIRELHAFCQRFRAA